MTTKVSSDMVSGDLNTFEFTYVIADPTASTYPVSIAVLNAFRLVGTNYSHYVSSGSATSQFDILKNGTPLTDYTNLVTVDSQVTQSTSSITNSDFVTDDVFEIRVDSVGANTTMLAFTFHGELA